MAIKNFSFSVDTINVNNNIVANVKQLDNAIFNITITENNQLKDLTNQTIKLFVKKADGSILVQTDNITLSDPANGKIQININNSIFATAGIVIGEIDISGTDGDIATATFSFNVYEKIGDNDAIASKVDIDLFKQITDLMNTATKEIEQYKSYYDAFTTAGVSLEGLNDIKSYIDNNLANLKTENDNANTLSTSLKATIQDSTTAKTALETTITDSSTAKDTLQKVIDSANSQGYLTTEQLNTTLNTFVPYLIWQGISSDDCNTLTKNGFYSINAMTVDLSTTHFPVNNEWALLFVWSTQGATNGGTVIQIFYGLTSKRLFYRMFNDSGWRDWAEVVTTDTLNTSISNLQTTLQKAIDDNKTTLQTNIDDVKNSLSNLKTFPSNVAINDSDMTLTDNKNTGTFTVKTTAGDLALDNGYGSTVNVGAGGYFYPTADGTWALGKSGYRWSNLYTKNITNSSDKNLKENINYLAENPISNTNTTITIDDLYNFVKDNLKLATYDFKVGDSRKGKLGFIAQDFLNSAVGKSILTNADENNFLSYDLNNYINLLAGALQKAILNIEGLQTVSQMSTQSTVQSTLLGQQISNLLLQNIQLTQRVQALENKLNSNTTTIVNN